MPDTDADVREFQEKLRSLSFNGRRTPSKTIVDHTDTAVVHTTVKDESQDVRVVMKDAVRPHRPEMSFAHACAEMRKES